MKNSNCDRFRYIILLGLSCAIAFNLTTAEGQQRKRVVVSNLLSNNLRTDVGGEGLWLPQVNKTTTSFLPPQPGFVGQVYYVHTTNLQGLFSYRFAALAQTLTPRAVQHQWWPTHTITRYEVEGASTRLEIIETKFINDNEEVVSTLEIRNLGGTRAQLAFAVIDLLNGKVEPNAQSGIADAVAKSLEFSPTTYYFTSLRIKKKYLLSADGARPDEGGGVSGVIDLIPGASKQITTRLVFANDFKDCYAKLSRLKSEDALRQRIKTFDEWFTTNVPEFHCSDPAVEKMYYYRWYLVKKAYINTRKYVPDHPYRYPALYEGQMGTWFPKIIGFPIPLQIAEARWLKDKSIAYDQARNTIASEDFYGYLNWTAYALWQLHLVAPDEKFLQEALPAMKRFIALEEAKDEDKDWLPTVWGSWITGMEYQPSFFYFTNPRWDHTKSEEFIEGDIFSRDPNVYKRWLPVERVDEATFYYLNNVAVTRVAEALGDQTTANEYRARAGKIKQAVLAKLWDAKTRFFYDIHPVTDEKAIEAKSVVGFYPFIFGEMVGKEHLSVFDHMSNPREFWTPWPVSSASQDSPAYDSRGYWKLGPHASPQNPHWYIDSWNGPTWILSEALAVEALGGAVRLSRSPALREMLNKLMKTYTEIQYLRGDHSLPLTVEHYDSQTGEPIRLLYDYFHSSYNDLLIRFLVGITPRADHRLEIDPQVSGWDCFALHDVAYRNHRISVIFDRGAGVTRLPERGKGFFVLVDGREVYRATNPEHVIYNPVTAKAERVTKP